MPSVSKFCRTADEYYERCLMPDCRINNYLTDRVNFR